MRTLERELEDARKDYISKVNATYSAYRFIHSVLPKLPEEPDVTTFCDYKTYADITFRCKDMEVVELTLIPHFSENFPFKRDKAWSKEVYSWGVQYRASFIDEESPVKDFTVDVEVNLHLSETCEMVAVPTGKVVQKSKLVTIEEPEFRYEFNCGNGGEDA